MLAVTAGLYVGFGLVSASLAPLVGTIADDIDLSRSQMGTVLGAWQFVYLGAAIPAGKYLDRVGLRAGLSTGIALIVLSGVLRAGANGWVSLMAAVGVFGLGGPLVSIGAPTLVSKWFPAEERGFATGLVVSGPVIGSMVTLLSANGLLMPTFNDQWRWVVLSYAAIAAVLGGAWLVVTARPPTDVAEPWSRPTVGRVSSRQLLRVPLVRIILVLAIMTFFVNHAARSWLPEILRDNGLTATEAGFWAAMVSVPGLIAGLTIPKMAKAEVRKPLLIGCYLVLGLGLAPLAGGWGPMAAIGILAYGAMRSVVLPIAMLFLMDSKDVGPSNMAGAGALYFTAGEIGGVAGPVAVGVLADRGGFAPAIWLMVAVAVGLAVVGATLRSS